MTTKERELLAEVLKAIAIRFALDHVSFSDESKHYDVKIVETRYGHNVVISIPFSIVDYQENEEDEDSDLEYSRPYKAGDLIKFRRGGKNLKKKIEKGTVIGENDTDDVDGRSYDVRPIGQEETIEVTEKEIVDDRPKPYTKGKK